jgi:hypothetical protein
MIVMSDDGKILAVGVAGVAAVLLTVWGISEIADAANDPDYDYTSVCQTADYIRLEDAACDRNDGGSFVMFISTSSDYNMPATGQRIDQSKVVKTVPAGKTTQKAGIPATGGVVKSSPNITRGGFGVSGGGSSSGS